MKQLFIALITLTLTYTGMAQVTKTIDVAVSGTLSTLLTATEKTTVTNLTVTGNIDARDFKCMRDEIDNLRILDISSTNITNYEGSEGTHTFTDFSSYKENSIPQMAFYSSNLEKRIPLTTIKLPYSITSIGNAAFSGCENLMGDLIIPNSVTYIDWDAFWKCSGISSIKIGSLTTNIGYSAFGYCNNISHFIVPEENKHFSAVDGVIFNKNKNKLIFFPSGKYTFYQFPENTDSISDAAFYSANGLWLTLTIPKSITYIGGSAFNDCPNLSEIVVDAENPNYASKDGALYTKNLSRLIKIPSGRNGSFSIDLNVDTIDGAFSNCRRLTEIKVDSLHKNFYSKDGVLFNKDTTTLIQYPLGKSGAYTMPNSVTRIEAVAFKNSSSVSQINFSNKLKLIGAAAFQNCTNLTTISSFPKVLKEINFYAFDNCSSLSGEVVLPDSIKSIDSFVFSGCKNIKGKVTIPDSVKYISVCAFNSLNNITELIIRSNLKNIYQEAFQNCNSLTKITLNQSIPPQIYKNTFNNVDKINCKLIVPAGSITTYKSAPYWSEFFQTTESLGIKILLGQNGDIFENNKKLSSESFAPIFNNESKTFTITPLPGYEVATLTYNGADVKSQIINNQYTTPPVAENCTLSVTFKRSIYKISVKLGGNGTMNLNYYYGDTPMFDFTPSSGAKIQSVFFNGVDVTANLVDNIYTMDPITTNGLLEVVFVSTATSTSNALGQLLSICKSENTIQVQGTIEGQKLSLYTINGSLISTTVAGGNLVTIPVSAKGLYMLRIENKTIKIAL